jgi:hypothetical protein
MPLLTTGVGKFQSAGGGAPAVTWDSGKMGSHFVLSGGNLVAAQNGSASNHEIVLSTTGHSSGKYYFEITAVVSNASLGLASAALGSYNDDMGITDAKTLGTYNGGQTYINSASIGSGWGWASVPDWLGIAVDFTAQKIWIQNITFAQPWNNDGAADPATGTNGWNISTLTNGPWYIAAQLPETQTSPGVTLNVGGTAYTGTAPSGFGNW